MFQFRQDENVYVTVKFKQSPKTRETVVVLYFDGENIPSYQETGRAVCHVNDEWNPTLGKKYALADALSGFPLEFRQMAWNAFFTWVKQTHARRNWLAGNMDRLIQEDPWGFRTRDFVRPGASA